MYIRLKGRGGGPSPTPLTQHNLAGHEPAVVRRATQGTKPKAVWRGQGEKNGPLKKQQKKRKYRLMRGSAQGNWLSRFSDKTMGKGPNQVPS